MTDAVPDNPTSVPPAGRDAAAVTRWVLLGASAGALAGFLIGGVGGRLAMLILRFTSSDAVIGVTSDDGFTIGRFSTETLFLLFFTTIIGGAAGLVYVAARWFLPARYRLLGWTVVGGLVGGAGLVHADGVDFTLLGPKWLSVAMFVAIPTGAAAAMATWVERWSAGWWWTNRRRTIIAAIPSLVAFSLLPLLAAAIVGGAAVVALGRVRQLRSVPSLPVIQVVSGVVLVVIAGFAALALANDIRGVFA